MFLKRLSEGRYWFPRLRFVRVVVSVRGFVGGYARSMKGFERGLQGEGVGSGCKQELGVIAHYEWYSRTEEQAEEKRTYREREQRLSEEDKRRLEWFKVFSRRG